MSAGRDALRAAGAPARMLLIGLVRLYRLTLSGLLGGQCRGGLTYLRVPIGGAAQRVSALDS